MSFLLALRRLWRGLPHAPDSALAFDDGGFRRAPPEAFVVPWPAIVRISGYKTDLWTADEVRIQVDLDSGDVVVFSEESPGFPALMVELERRYPTVVDWFERIALPTAETTATLVLYDATTAAHPEMPR